MSAPAFLHSIQSDRPLQVSQAVTCRHHQQASGHESHLERVEVVSKTVSHRSLSGRWPIGQWALGWWMLFAWQPLTLLAWQSNPVTPGAAPVASQRQAFDLQHKTADQAASLLAPLLPPGSSVQWIIVPSSRRLEVIGTSDVLGQIAKMLPMVDRPAVAQGDAEPAKMEAPEVRTYMAAPAPLRELAQWTQQHLAPQGVALVVDSASGQLIVRAPASLHLQIRQRLQDLTSPPSSRITDQPLPDATSPHADSDVAQASWPPASDASANRLPSQANAVELAVGSRNAAPADSANAPWIQSSLPMPADRWPLLQRDLQRLFGDRWRVQEGGRAAALSDTRGNQIALHWDPSRQMLLWSSPSSSAIQLQRLILEASRSTVAGPTTAQQRVVRGSVDSASAIQAIVEQTRSIASGDLLPSSKNPNASLVQPANYQDAPASVPPANAAPSNPEEKGEPAPASGTRGSQFEGVQIETLPELDAMILRGRNEELDQLAEIIKQLEQVGEGTRPEIAVVPLEHANASRVATIITTTQDDLTGGLQGRAFATPLVKPNAILLIGWGEALKALRELVSKLDQPVEPETQLEVFRLKHAKASALQTSLQSFFATRQGLGPVILSTIDARTNSLVVYAAPRDLEEIRLLIEKLDVPQSSAMQRVQVFPIENSLAADVAETLRDAIQNPGTGDRNAGLELIGEDGQSLAASGILDDLQVTVNERNNSVIVTGPPESFDLIAQLIGQLDTPGMVAKIKIFPIENGDAASLVETLRSLLPSQTGDASDVQLGSAPGESSLAPLRFTVDTRGNNIVATGSEGDLRIVEALLTRLDEAGSAQRKSTIYQLKNSPALDVALAINDFLRNQRILETAAPGTANPFEQLEREVIVVPEPVANKLILSATPRYFGEILELIQKLDEQPPQVMIQVMIAEVTLGDFDEFGVEIGVQDSVLFDRSLLGDLITTTTTTNVSTPSGVVTETQENIVAATNEPGFDFNNKPLGNSGSANALAQSEKVGEQALSSFALGRVNNELGFGGLVLSASSRNVSFLLRALQETRRMEVLSRPQVLTLDNQPAFIQVGQRVPRIIGSIVNQNGQQNNIALENVGLIIGVTPRISPEGNVVMEIDAEKSSLGPETEGIPVSVANNGTIIRSPRVDTTTAQATVLAADGETIILGGLITKSTRERHRKVPFLGDIPIVKYLFRYDQVETKRTELLIILTPHVVRSPGDMERLKQVETARMSWCAADVFDIHGDIQVPMQWGMMTDESNVPVIYPDDDPRGTRSLLPAGPEGEGSAGPIELQEGEEWRSYPPVPEHPKEGGVYYERETGQVPITPPPQVPRRSLPPAREYEPDPMELPSPVQATPPQTNPLPSGVEGTRRAPVREAPQPNWPESNEGGRR